MKKQGSGDFLCDCEAFQRRRTCTHIDQVRQFVKAGGSYNRVRDTAIDLDDMIRDLEKGQDDE